MDVIMIPKRLQYKERDNAVAPQGSWTKNKVSIANDNPITDTGATSAVIDLAENNYERIHFQVQATWELTTNYDLKFQIQTSLDGTIFDDEYSTFTILNSASLDFIEYRAQ